MANKYSASTYLYNKNYIAVPKIITYIEHLQKIETLTIQEFEKLRDEQAANTVNKILTKQLNKNYIYVYAYSYKNELGLCGFIVTKQFNLDNEQYNLFVKELKEKYKRVKIRAIRGDLL